MPEKPRRRWFRFRLWKPLAALGLVASLASWEIHSVDWIAARTEAIRSMHVSDNGYTRAPGGLWVFGERGYRRLEFRGLGWDCTGGPDYESLFPEAKVVRRR
jgi:hypothetical protein